MAITNSIQSSGITLAEFHKLLKSRQFKSKNANRESFKISFTEIHVYRDTKYYCDYEVIQNGDNFELKFSRDYNTLTLPEFKNVLFVCDNLKFVINKELQNPSPSNYDLVLEAI